jgi:hypothetical protein
VQVQEETKHSLITFDIGTIYKFCEIILEYISRKSFIF